MTAKERTQTLSNLRSHGRGRRTRTLNKGFGDPRVTITPCPYVLSNRIHYTGNPQFCQYPSFHSSTFVCVAGARLREGLRCACRGSPNLTCAHVFVLQFKYASVVRWRATRHNAVSGGLCGLYARRNDYVHESGDPAAAQGAGHDPGTGGAGAERDRTGGDQLLDAAAKPWRPGDTLLFRRLDDGRPAADMRPMLDTLLRNLESDPACDFLRAEPEFQALIAEHRAQSDPKDAP